MAAAPRWKVYGCDLSQRTESECYRYRAACHELAAAIVLADWYGEGSEVRDGHTRGKDHRYVAYRRYGTDCVSYDNVERLYFERLAELRERHKLGRQ